MRAQSESAGGRARVVCIFVILVQGVVRIWQWLCSWVGVLYQSNKEVYSAYGISVVVSPFRLFCVAICRYSYVCVLMGGEIYILTFYTLSMVVIIGVYDLSVEVELHTFI